MQVIIYIKKKTDKFIKHQSCYCIETSQLICRTNQLPGFYMMAILVFNELMNFNLTKPGYDGY